MKTNDIRIQKERNKNVFSRLYYMHVENPKESMERLLELMSKFKMVIGYKVNNKTNFIFIYQLQTFIK